MPLRRRSPLRANAPLKRRSPLRTKAKGSGRPKDTGPDRTTRELVLERDSGCVICGAGPYGLQVHHRKPRRMGGRKVPGSNSPSNLISLCRADHEWVESRRTEALDHGWLVREIDDPASVPVHHVAFGLVYLLDDGNWLPAGEPGTDRLLADLREDTP